MSVDKHIIGELKNAILKSRYQAARLINNEFVLLYFGIGRKISKNGRKEAYFNKATEGLPITLVSTQPVQECFTGRRNLKK